MGVLPFRLGFWFGLLEFGLFGGFCFLFVWFEPFVGFGFGFSLVGVWVILCLGCYGWVLSVCCFGLWVSVIWVFDALLSLLGCFWGWVVLGAVWFGFN